MPALAEVNLVTAAAIFVVGLLGGVVLARLVLPSRRRLRELTSELEQSRSEHQAYRAEVSDHFEKTSDLVASMTASYKAVYDHLKVGAQTLCRDATLGAGRFPSPRLVLDQDVAVERLGGGAQADETPSERAAPSDRIAGPILEMKREEPQSGQDPVAQAGTEERAAEEGDGETRSPLH